jgi:hypothetical protein
MGCFSWRRPQQSRSVMQARYTVDLPCTDESPPESGSTGFPSSDSNIPSPSSFEQLSPSSDISLQKPQLAAQRLELSRVDNISQLKQLPAVLDADKQCRCRRQRADLAPDHAALAKEAFELRRENEILRIKVKKLEDRQETLLDIIQDRRGGDDSRRRRNSGTELRR